MSGRSSTPWLNEPQVRVGSRYEEVYLQALLIAEVVEFLPQSLVGPMFPTAA